MSKVLVDADVLRELLAARYELQALECGGVDNWCGYCESRSGEYSGDQSVSDFTDEIYEASDEDLVKYL